MSQIEKILRLWLGFESTDSLAIMFHLVTPLTNQPLEAPLKGFPPNQPNLLSAIQTSLEET